MSGSDRDLEVALRDRAYSIWEREGRPDGGARDHWLAAIEEAERQPELGEEEKPW
jgi:hypothetical protein